jgi:hypothetical protein
MSTHTQVNLETIIVFIDDAAYATQLLQPMLSAENDDPMRWVLVGCAPRITRRISKWVTQSARHSWQASWADKVFAQVMPTLQTPGRSQDIITTQLAPSQINLCELTQSLTKQYARSRVLDVRRPKLGYELAPVKAGQVQPSNRMTGYATALAGAGMLAALD